GTRQGGVDIEKWHRPVAGNDDVRERPETAIEQEVHEPSWAGEYLRKEGNLRKQIAADKLLHSVPVVALADSGDRCVDGNDWSGDPGDPYASNDSFGGGTPAHEIELVEDRAGGAGLHVLQPVS